MFNLLFRFGQKTIQPISSYEVLHCNTLTFSKKEESVKEKETIFLKLSHMICIENKIEAGAFQNNHYRNT